MWKNYPRPYGGKLRQQYRCRNFTQDLMVENCDNDIVFDLCGPSGVKKCKWLDPYMGLFQVDGSSSFMMVSDIMFMDVWCENIRLNEG